MYPMTAPIPVTPLAATNRPQSSALAAPRYILFYADDGKWHLACYRNKPLKALLEKSYGEFDVQSNADRNRSIYSRTSDDVRANVRNIRAQLSRDPQLCRAACSRNYRD